MEQTLPTNAIELAEAYITQHELFSLLELQVDSLELGEVELTVPYDERFTNPGSPPPIHGGIIATLIDSAGAFALRPYLDDPVGDSTATISLNVNYLQPVSSDITATTTVVEVGRTVGHTETIVEGETSDGQTGTVANGQAVYRLFQ